MKRHALLIASPKSKYGNLPGTSVDIGRVRDWLLSNRGGAWEATEIETFTNPTHSTLKAWLARQSSCDYVFNLFAGHGYTVQGEYAVESAICLNDNEEILLRDLNPGNSRCSIFSDSCRKFEVELPPELFMEKRAMERLAAKAMDERARMRALFDRSVMASDEGALYFYSCGKNQSAGEDPDQGGLFTYSFVKCADGWSAAARSKNMVMGINQTFEGARESTTAMAPQQKPEMGGGVRRRAYFPFAVT